MKHLLFALALTGFPLFGGASISYAAPTPALPPVPKAGAPVAAAPATANPSNGVAADVNGDKILLADLNRQINDIKATEPALQTNSADATTALSSLRSQMLDGLIVRKLLSQEARRRNIITKPADVDTLIEQTKKQFKTPAEFNSWLSDRGVNAGELRAVLADEIAMDELTAQITSDVTVSDADMGAYYRANPDQFTVQPAVKVSHILLAINPSASAADKEAVRKRALSLISQLKKGADFATLAKSNSDDIGTKSDGGSLPIFERGRMEKPFEDAAFSGKKGDILGPIETGYGMHIIKIEQVLPQKIVELKDVKDDPRLRALVMQQKKQAKFDAFVAGLTAAAKIQKYV